jgi:hypothetical protein
MSAFAKHPEDVPVADWAEQQEDADPSRDEDEAAPAARSGVGDAEADEADLAEQSIEVFYPEES